MEIVDGYLPLALIARAVHYTVIVLKLRAQQPNNVNLGVNCVSQMEYLVFKYQIAYPIKLNKLA